MSRDHHHGYTSSNKKPIVFKARVTNMATTRKFDVVSYKFNVGQYRLWTAVTLALQNFLKTATSVAIDV